MQYRYHWYIPFLEQSIAEISLPHSWNSTVNGAFLYWISLYWCTPFIEMALSLIQSYIKISLSYVHSIIQISLNWCTPLLKYSIIGALLYWNIIWRKRLLRLFLQIEIIRYSLYFSFQMHQWKTQANICPRVDVFVTPHKLAPLYDINSFSVWSLAIQYALCNSWNI